MRAVAYAGEICASRAALPHRIFTCKTPHAHFPRRVARRTLARIVSPRRSFSRTLFFSRCSGYHWAKSGDISSIVVVGRRKWLANARRGQGRRIITGGMFACGSETRRRMWKTAASPAPRSSGAQLASLALKSSSPHLFVHCTAPHRAKIFCASARRRRSRAASHLARSVKSVMAGGGDGGITSVPRHTVSCRFGLLAASCRRA